MAQCSAPTIAGIDGRRRASVAEGLSGVTCASVTACVAVGPGGVLIRSTDGGITWTAPITLRDEDGSLQDLWGVACANENSCIAGGHNGTVQRGAAGGGAGADVPRPRT
jgi:photosystem II stability/assembly factor-like uncharacterized protein